MNAIGHILKLGANVKEVDHTGASAQYYAAREGHAELAVFFAIMEATLMRMV